MLRVAFTVLILLVVRVLSHITVPLFNANAIRNFIEQSGSFVAILNNFSGRALERFSIMALGISPYITASIVVQLLQMVVPKFKEIAQEGDKGKQRLNKYTRYGAVILAFVQAFILIIGTNQGPGSILIVELEGYDITNYRYLFYIYMALVMAAGTALAIWLGDLITKKGIGNGTSILIVAGIVTSLPTMITMLWGKYISATGTDGWDVVWFMLIILFYFAILLGVVYMQIAVRKIPIQYANRQGKADSNIPMKLNSAGVIPVIFAQTILSIPLTISGALGQTSSFAQWIGAIFNYQQPMGFILYVLLIIIFSFFYSFLTVDPEKIADNLSKSNAYIPGIRPGEETKNYVARLLFKITVIGTAYLVVLAILPLLTSIVLGFNAAESQAITLGGTSLLIIVGVAIETTQQLETDASQAEYGGIFARR